MAEWRIRELRRSLCERERRLELSRLWIVESAVAADLSVSQSERPLHGGAGDEARGVLERLGEAVFEPEDVSVPLVFGGDPEKETFQWFVSNERSGRPHRLRALEPPTEGRSPEVGWPRLPRLPEKSRAD